MLGLALMSRNTPHLSWAVAAIPHRMREDVIITLSGTKKLMLLISLELLETTQLNPVVL